jgi:hypothetical protein
LRVSNEKKLKLSNRKFEPFSTATVALGLRVSKNGISLDLNKVCNIRQWKRPDSMKKLSLLIGLFVYFADHIKNLSYNIQHLKISTDKLKIKNFIWTKEMEQEFLEIAEKIVLRYCSIEKEIMNYLSKCKICLQESTGKTPIFYNVTNLSDLYPNSRWLLDLITMKEDSDGFKYIFHSQDVFLQHDCTSQIKRNRRNC